MMKIKPTLKGEDALAELNAKRELPDGIEATQEDQIVKSSNQLLGSTTLSGQGVAVANEVYTVATGEFSRNLINDGWVPLEMPSKMIPYDVDTILVASF